MTNQMTKNTVKMFFEKQIEIGYCDFQYMLRPYTRKGYGADVYGWNWDCFPVAYNMNGNDVCIITGYRPFGNVHPDYKTVERYENAAHEIYGDYSKSYNEQTKEVENLMNKFLSEVLER